MKISNTLVVLDLETTGTWVDRDRIIEIAMIKCFPDGKKDSGLFSAHTSSLPRKIIFTAEAAEIAGTTADPKTASVLQDDLFGVSGPFSSLFPASFARSAVPSFGS